MNVSKRFLRDFAYLANLYSWNAADIEDVKAQTRSNPSEMRNYWTALAAAHRAGYEQTAGNGYMRLAHWDQLATKKAGNFVDQVVEKWRDAANGANAHMDHRITINHLCDAPPGGKP